MMEAPMESVMKKTREEAHVVLARWAEQGLSALQVVGILGYIAGAMDCLRPLGDEGAAGITYDSFAGLAHEEADTALVIGIADAAAKIVANDTWKVD